MKIHKTLRVPPNVSKGRMLLHKKCLNIKRGCNGILEIPTTKGYSEVSREVTSEKKTSRIP